MRNNEIFAFNLNNRTSNSIKTSFWGVSKMIVEIGLSFLFRTIFISYLDADYLGLNGLFTNILQVLSLAELGITTAIVYRFYEPISNNNVSQVSRIMNYLKKVYRYIAIFILFCGLIITPFIRWFINDSSRIPTDINIYYIYILFLVNTVSSYLFIYKQSILTADQRGYVVSVGGILTSLFKYIFQIIFLIITGDYTCTLIIGIIVTILSNIIFSKWTHIKYKPVFEEKNDLSYAEKKQIINDTKVLMYHKVGATVKLSTDSMILSKCIGLFAAGVYSNYSMVITGLQNLINHLIGNFASSIGNAHIKLPNEENYKIYNKLLFIDLWISVVVTSCLFVVLNPFIILWIGTKYVFDKITVILLCVQFFMLISRQINISYINGCGLFNKDKYRPIIEAVLNLIFSIIGVKVWGILGVFLGTVISSAVTVWWREPYILFKTEFKKPVVMYWKLYFEFLVCMVLLCIAENLIIENITINSILQLFYLGIVCFFLTNIFMFLIFRKTKIYRDIIGTIKSRIKNKSFK